MGSTTHSIEINAPLRVVYSQWTQFEEFPAFMEGVEEVRQEDEKRLFWRAKIGGKVKEWKSEITSQVPDEKIAWKSVDGSPNSGTVRFQELAPDRTIVTATIEYEPEGFFEKAGDAFGIPSGQVEEDLKRFRDYIEERGRETGGWRGQIGEGESPTLGSTQALRQEQDFRPGLTGGVLRETGSALKREEAPIEHIQAFETRPSGNEPSQEERFAVPLSQQEPVAEEEPGLSGDVRIRKTEGIKPKAIQKNARPDAKEIASRAYELYLKRESIPGFEMQDWLQAEKELIEESTSEK
jgi:Polyketide cyclase / dehydrase and lipid transport/Protein of unknown function (DUF2934)